MLTQEYRRLATQARVRIWAADRGVPLRINRREPDGALGGLAWHPEFVGYLVRRSKEHHRLVRAFRRLRRISPEAYDLLWLIVMGRLSYEEATARINASRERAGQRRLSPVEMAAFLVSGLDLLISRR